MTFGQAFKFVYRESWTFLLMCPLLALIPAAVELIQHVAEVRLGMYDSIEIAKSMDGDQTRLMFGLVKVMTLILAQYWVIRFIHWGRNGKAAGQFTSASVRTFAPFFVFELILAVVELFVLPRSGPVLAATMVVSFAVMPLLNAWVVGAALGDPAMGPVRSIRQVAPHLIWAIVFGLIATIPLMVPHYALAAAALLGPKPLLWPVLIFDSLLVTYLAAVMAAINYAISLRAGYPPQA